MAVILERNLLNTATASFSPDRRYRYRLTRTFDGPKTEKNAAIWLMLNPSTADAFKLDPTLRRVESFSRDWGHRGFVVLNLFALRATDPAELKRASDPVGPENDDVLSWYDPFEIVCGWGAHPMAVERARQVVRLLPNARFVCLGTTASGEPKHPLYVKGDTPKQVWRPR